MVLVQAATIRKLMYSGPIWESSVYQVWKICSGSQVCIAAIGMMSAAIEKVLW
jgi:hypothetical protein